MIATCGSSFPTGKRKILSGMESPKKRKVERCQGFVRLVRAPIGLGLYTVQIGAILPESRKGLSAVGKNNEPYPIHEMPYHREVVAFE